MSDSDHQPYQCDAPDCDFATGDECEMHLHRKTHRDPDATTTEPRVDE